MIDGPEDCPTPIFHETHRYCPSCSWTEVPISPDSSLREQLEAALKEGLDLWWTFSRNFNELPEKLANSLERFVSAGLAAARADEREKIAKDATGRLLKPIGSHDDYANGWNAALDVMADLARSAGVEPKEQQP